MYWKNINALKELLMHGELPQKMQMWYLLVTFALYEIFMELGTYVQEESNPAYLDYIVSVVSVLLVILTIVYSYVVNGKERGRYLMQRYISINFVVGFRYMFLIFITILIVIVAVSIILENIYSIDFFDKYIDIVFFIGTIALEITIMLSTIKHIKDVAENFSKE